MYLRFKQTSRSQMYEYEWIRGSDGVVNSQLMLNRKCANYDDEKTVAVGQKFVRWTKSKCYEYKKYNACFFGSIRRPQSKYFLNIIYSLVVRSVLLTILITRLLNIQRVTNGMRPFACLFLTEKSVRGATKWDLYLTMSNFFLNEKHFSPHKRRSWNVPPTLDFQMRT